MKWLQTFSLVFRSNVNALAEQLQMTLPPFVAPTRPIDNWQTSPGMERARGLTDLQAAGAHDEHAD